MNQPLNKASKRLAQAAVLTLAITGISAPSFAFVETATFQIDVTAPVNPCDTYTPISTVATWDPDGYVTLSEVGNASNQSQPGVIFVGPNSAVDMTVDLHWENGDTCGVDGSPDYTVEPTGLVTAAWDMSAATDISLDGTENCVAAGCSAATKPSIEATGLVAGNALTGANSGDVRIEWTP